jgi:hypothetical protein
MALIFRVRTIWEGVGGSPYYTNLYFTDNASGATALSAASAVDTMFENIAGNISNLLSWTVQGDCPIIDDATGTLTGAYSVGNRFGNGTNVSELLPRQAQGMIRWDTSVVVGGRRLRGRTFVPGPTEPLNEQGGQPVVGYVDGLEGTGEFLRDSPGNELRVYSPTHHTSAVVTGVGAAPYWANLRSRRD